MKRISGALDGLKLKSESSSEKLADSGVARPLKTDWPSTSQFPWPAASLRSEVARPHVTREDWNGFEVFSHAPTRLSFAGGGTDISPYPETYGGFALNAAISIYMIAQLRLRSDSKVIIHANTRAEPMVYMSMVDLNFDGQLDFIKVIIKKMYTRSNGFELYIYSSLPLRSGLGGSASMCVAVLNAFNHIQGEDRLDRHELAEMALEIETKYLGNASGRQDQYAASFGGMNLFEFNGGSRVRVNPVTVPDAGRRTLNHAIVLFSIGSRMASGKIVEDLVAGIQSDSDQLEAMHRSKALIPEMMEALQAVDVTRIGMLLHTLWQEKKRFSRLVSNHAIDELYAHLQDAGMIGGKVTGAGGGGHLLACCDIERRDQVITAAQELGARVVPFTFVSEGVLSWESPVRTVG